jgi:hypothetical protein
MRTRRAAGLAWVLGWAVSAALAPPATAEGTEDERLRRLEEALARQTQETERLRRDFDAYRAANPARARPTDEEVGAQVDAYLARCGEGGGAPVAVPTAGSLLGGPSGIRWGGYLHSKLVERTDEASYFDLHRLILTLDASITDRIDFDAEIELEHGGVSDEIEGEVVVEKAEVRFHVTDGLVPKLGWLLVPFGRFNLYHDDPINDLTERPFTARFLVPTGFGQPGVGVEGVVPFGAGHLFSYDVAVTNGYRDAFTADEGVREARQATDENDGKQVWGRAAVVWCATSVLDVLETGVSGTWGLYDAEDRNTITGFAADLTLRKGPFEAKAEYVAYDYERDSADDPDAIRGQEGAYVEAGWHFFPTAWCGYDSAFFTDTSLFTLVARWQWMDLDDRRRGAAFEDDLEAWTLGLNFRVTERTVFRVDHTWYLPETGEDVREWTASFSTYF